VEATFGMWHLLVGKLFLNDCCCMQVQEALRQYNVQSVHPSLQAYLNQAAWLHMEGLLTQACKMASQRADLSRSVSMRLFTYHLLLSVLLLIALVSCWLGSVVVKTHVIVGSCLTSNHAADVPCIKMSGHAGMQETGGHADDDRCAQSAG